MENKLLTVGECMKDLIYKDGEVPSSLLSPYPHNSNPSIEEPNFGGVFHNQVVDCGGIYIPDTDDPLYSEVVRAKQASCDIEQLNETVFEDVYQDYLGNLIVNRCSRNGRQRQFLVAVGNLHLRGKLWETTGNEGGKIAELEFSANGRREIVFCNVDRIKGRRLADTLQQSGVIFNTDMSFEREAKLVNSFVLKLLGSAELRWAPRFRGWSKVDGVMKFYQEEETWGWMKKQLNF